ncbi:MAG: hypothetical protein JO352_00750 [Chloroflexi bacterium]|nr:hypothetical protein [Chloroflexota bacterium]
MTFAKAEGGAPRELLLGYLSERRVLLVLDNFEHLLEAPLIADLVVRCPRLASLVTSIQTSHGWGVLPLPG